MSTFILSIYLSIFIYYLLITKFFPFSLSMFHVTRKKDQLKVDSALSYAIFFSISTIPRLIHHALSVNSPLFLLFSVTIRFFLLQAVAFSHLRHHVLSVIRHLSLQPPITALKSYANIHLRESYVRQVRSGVTGVRCGLSPLAQVCSRCVYLGLLNRVFLEHLLCGVVRPSS